MFQVGTFVFSIVAFLIVLWLVSRFGFKPMANMLEQRRLHIESQITDAERGRSEAEQLLLEQRALLEQARIDARQLLDAARVRADEQARGILQEAQAEAQRLLQEGRTLIERERTEALNAALQKVASLSVELTDRLLRVHASDATHQQMIEQAQQQLGELVC